MATFAGYHQGADAFPEFEVAGRWRRLLAFVLDQLIVGIPTGIIAFVVFLSLIGGWNGMLVTHPDGSVSFADWAGERVQRAATVATFLILGMVASYYVFCTALWGKTLGKAICDIRVIDITSGGVPTLAASVLRHGVYAGGSIFSVSAGALGFALGMWEFVIAIAWLSIVGWIFVDPASRGIHDLAARTVVVLDPPRIPGQSIPGRATILETMPGLQLAGRPRRFAAFLLDVVFLVVPFAIVTFVFMAVYVGPLDGGASGGPMAAIEAERRSDRAMAIAAVLFVPYVLAYLTICHSFGGRTLAKSMLSIRVLDLWTGKPPSLSASVLRACLVAGPGLGATTLMLLMAPLVILAWAAMIGWLAAVGWILIDSHARGLHDLVAGTLVAYEPRSTYPVEVSPVSHGW